MVTVRMLCAMAGPDDDVRIGDLVDVDDATAARLIDGQLAEPAAALPAAADTPTPKRARRAKTETATQADDGVETATR